jgi:ABC-2 type transport system permease protein
MIYMLWLFAKNDLKRFFRDKMGMFMLIIFPVLLIFILSSAFSSTMNKSFKLEPFSVGYSITQNSPLYGSINTITDGLIKQKITLIKMDKGSALREITNRKLAGYVEFSGNSYIFHKSDDMKISASIFESILSSISYTTGTYSGMYKYFADNKIKPNDNQNINSASKNLLQIEKIKVEPAPSSMQYYGIVMLINTLTFSLVAGAAIINNDRKRRVNLRIGLTKVSPIIIFFARTLSSVVTSMLQITIAIIASILLLKVDFGTHYIQVFLLILLYSATVSTLGVALGYLIKSLSITRTIVFAASFFLNFFGGSYTPYVFAVDDFLSLMKKTPLYYINRSLVEITTKGYSNLVSTAVTIEVSVIVISLLIGILAYSRREARLCEI